MAGLATASAVEVGGGSLVATATSVATTATVVPVPYVSWDDCIYAQPDSNGNVPAWACQAYYLYYPSKAGNVVFAVLFALVTLIHFQQACHYRKGYCWVIITAGLGEFVAFTVRAVGAQKQQQRGLIPGSNMLFLLAPLWINAFVYMTFSRLRRYSIPIGDEWHDRYRWISRWYFWMLLTAATAQAAAVGIMFTGHAPTFEAAQKVYVAGIAVQGIFNLELAYVASKAYRKIVNLDRFDRNLVRVKLLLWAIYAALGLLMLRIIFRVVDFSLGQNTSNALATSEIPAFVLDALPMLLAMLVFNICHPGRVIPSATKEQRRQSRAASSPVVAPQPKHFVNEDPPNYEPQPFAQVPDAAGEAGRRHQDDEKGDFTSVDVEEHAPKHQTWKAAGK